MPRKSKKSTKKTELVLDYETINISVNEKPVEEVVSTPPLETNDFMYRVISEKDYDERVKYIKKRLSNPKLTPEKRTSYINYLKKLDTQYEKI